jgi:5-methyltetrahydrofolate--homocysteine methyltransferase
VADYFAPVGSGLVDVVALQVVTVGQQASDSAREWFSADRYSDYLHLHGLSVESAEALAEYVHRQIRADLGIAADDAREIRKLIKTDYRGCRYSFGYPACPRLEDQRLLLELLDAKRIGVVLGEEFQLWPEQSTSAIVVHHPQAGYFSI